MNASIRLGRIFGIPIGINYSWFITFFLIASSLYFWFRQISEDQGLGWTTATLVPVAAVATVLFFVSLVIHELSHSLVAMAQGVPVHGITLFVFGGVSQISKESSNARHEFTMAVVGPLSSFVLAALFGGLYFLTWDTASLIAVPVGTLAWVNVALGVFNLVPGYPLDGGRVLRSIIWGATGSMEKATRVAASVGQLVGYLIIGYGIFTLLFANNFLGGLWAIFIGWFLQSAASSSTQQMRLRSALEGFRVRDVMSADCPTVPGDVSLEALVNEHILPTGRRFFVVTDDGRVKGLISLTTIKEVPRDAWRQTSVERAMVPLERLRHVRPDEDVYHVLELMQEADVNQLPVLDGGRLIGVVTRDRVLRLIAVRAELQE